MPSLRRNRGLVVAWMPVSQRSSTLAGRLGFTVVLIKRAGYRSPLTAPLAYPIAAVRTLAALIRYRPRAVVVVAPPVVAPLVVVPLARLFRVPVAIDVHSGALIDARWRWAIGLMRALTQLAGTACVHLPQLAPVLRTRRGRVMVVRDPLPRFAVGSVDQVDTGGMKLVVAVCGWGEDEPVEALVGAAAGRMWRLAVTGKPRREIPLPSNTQLTGFLDQDAYVRLLASADLIVVLTVRENTLLSGAWEAIALHRPLLVSATSALRDAFGPEVARLEPDAGSIARAIDEVLADPAAQSRTESLAARYATENDEAVQRLAGALGVHLA